MFGNELNETSETGVPLKVTTLARDRRWANARGAAAWCGRGYVGSAKGRVHPFDGLPKLYTIRLHDGQARFHTRFVRNRVHERTMHDGHVPPMVTVSPEATGASRWRPHQILRSLDLMRRPDAGTGALEVQSVHGRTIVGYEGLSYAAEVDIESLATLREHRMSRAAGARFIAMGAAYLAPFHGDGTYYTHVLELDVLKLGMRPRFYPARIERDMSLTYFEPATLDACVDVHNLAVTARFVVAIVCPEKIRLDRIVLRGNVIESLVDDPARTNTFLVWDRKTGKLLHTIHSSLHFTFNHFVRSHDDGASIVLDLIECPSAQDRITLPKGPSDRFVMGGKVARYRVALGTHVITREEVFAGPCEMPASEPGSPHAFANCFEDRPEGQAWGLCSIYDGRTFFPPDGARIFAAPLVHDDLIHVLAVDARFERYEWWCLDAPTLSVRAKAVLPESVGMVAHGNWFELARPPVWFTRRDRAPASVEVAL